MSAFGHSHRLAAVTATGLVVLLAACGGGASTPGTAPTTGGAGSAAPVEITLWHGQVDVAQKTLDAMVADFNTSHPKIVVKTDSGGTTTDNMLEKVQAALAADAAPDISYLYGSQLAQLVATGKVADLTAEVKEPSWAWSDFWPAMQDGVVVDGKVRGIPSAIGDFAVIYNKSLLAAKGIAEPTSDWTWSDFRAVALKATDKAAGTFGTGFPVDGSEDTAVRFLYKLWQGGGDLLNADNTSATFNTPAGVTALETYRAMAVDDRSMYLDAQNAGKIEQLFNAGKIAFFVTGPWELETVTAAKIDYGTQVLPGTNGDHTTTAGTDSWVVYDHGPARKAAAATFLKWLTQPAQDARWALATGSLPLRSTTVSDPGFASFYTTYPGNDLFVKNLANAKRAKPRTTALPEVFTAVGKAVSAVLLGHGDAKAALDGAAQQANAALAGQ